MPDRTTTQTYHISKIIEAPRPFVYEWCTDFREDDGKLTGSKRKRKILEKTKKRVIIAQSYLENGKESGHVSVVTLKPPDSWHLDTAGNIHEQEIGDYKLTRLGKSRTRLDMVFRVKYSGGAKIPSKKWWEEDSHRFWDKLIIALMRDYSKLEKEKNKKQQE
jgi:hypothetical protein